MKVAILGLGEAGSLYAEAYAQAGHTVSGYDPRDVEVALGVEKAETQAEAVRDADLVMGLTTARPALQAARDAAEHLRPGAVYLDLNAASPQLKEEIAEAIGAAGRVVDGAVIGSVRKYGAQVHVLLSGPHAAEAAELLGTIGAHAEPIGGEVGDASKRKLLRSVFMKGLGALITESMEAGEAVGQADWVRQQIAEAITDGEQALDRLWSGTSLHAARRGAELQASLDLLTAHRGEWPMTRGAQATHLRLARESASANQAADAAGDLSLADALRQIPTSALGDAGDRLGFVRAAVKPVWKSAPVAGRAFPVHTRPGDNLGIHEAIRQAAPGDVIVVDGGGHTERALIGELMAERSQRKGIAGMIIDGSVRDADELEALGFPVWAAGVSPAGPYKHGPYRLGEAISLGGAVCAPGDYVVADSDGVLVVPALRAESLVMGGRAVIQDERNRQEAIRAGA
ncbi:NAD(P)-binding domain-containing protein [Brevibacterium salitolerans]|uniref:Putative 4-hydroxy-4-methyl-2-oxoglutarate aldolase n=1 Tax=Brevibacterium salitolerans TaxID=1403566 RepID=A0ABN2WN59_9MICO